MPWSKTNKSYSPWNLDVYQDVGRILRGQELLRFLEQCCEDSCMVGVSAVGSDESVEARFSQVGDDVLVMECDEPVSFERGETLVLRFDCGRDMLFRSPLREAEDREGYTLLKLRLPQEVSSADSRQNFRVPTAECLDMVARFEFEGVPHEGVVLDVSAGGLCADMLSAGTLGLKVGDHGRLLLKYQEVWTESEVEVRQVRGSIVHLMYFNEDKKKKKKKR